MSIPRCIRPKATYKVNPAPCLLWKLKKGGEVQLNLVVNNLLNAGRNLLAGDLSASPRRCGRRERLHSSAREPLPARSRLKSHQLHAVDDASTYNN